MPVPRSVPACGSAASDRVTRDRISLDGAVYSPRRPAGLQRPTRHGPTMAVQPQLTPQTAPEHPQGQDDAPAGVVGPQTPVAA